MPLSVNHKDYVTAIKALPEFDSPATFNLPLNIERAQQISVALGVISQLKVQYIQLKVQYIQYIQLKVQYIQLKVQYIQYIQLKVQYMYSTYNSR